MEADIQTGMIMEQPQVENAGLEIEECDEDEYEPSHLMAVCDEDDAREWMAEGDVKGGPLDAGKVREARATEMKFLKDRQVYGYARVWDAWEKTGKAPIGLKWIDSNKGTESNPKYRSRLVCTEV